MTGRDDRSRRLQDLLDGYLTPDQEAGVLRRVRADAAWRREHESLRGVYDLLDTPLDDEPPADLLPGVMAALETEAIRRAARRRLPARVENGLVVAGAAAVAALLVVIGRLVSSETLLGRIAVGGADAMSVATRWIVEGADAWARLDWVTRSLSTLADAARTVVAAAAEPLLGVGIVSVAFTVGLGWLLLRTGTTRGGWSHG